MARARTSAYRRAVDEAIREKNEPLANLTLEEIVRLYERALWHLTWSALRRGKRVTIRRERDE